MYSIVRTMEWDGLPGCVRYWCGQGDSPLDNPMYSIVWTMEWEGLPDCVKYWCGSIGQSHVFHSTDYGMGRIAGLCEVHCTGVDKGIVHWTIPCIP